MKQKLFAKVIWGNNANFLSLFFLLLHSALVFNVKIKKSHDFNKKIKWTSVRPERKKTKIKEYKR